MIMRNMIIRICLLLFLVFVYNCSDNSIKGNRVVENSVKHESIEHEYVDLGLPSGIKWATCNIGASNPYEQGDFFAWGEAKTKNEFTDQNYELRYTLADTLPDYGNSLDNINRYDAASIQWGGKWRVPTKEDFQELIDNCVWDYERSGYNVTGPNGNSIYLPAIYGAYDGNSASKSGTYWSSTGSIHKAWMLVISKGYYSVKTAYSTIGQNIRPVCD